MPLPLLLLLLSQERQVFGLTRPRCRHARFVYRTTHTHTHTAVRSSAHPHGESLYYLLASHSTGSLLCIYKLPVYKRTHSDQYDNPRRGVRTIYDPTQAHTRTDDESCRLRLRTAREIGTHKLLYTSQLCVWPALPTPIVVL